MENASNTTTSIEAKHSERELVKLIETRSTNITKMLNFKKWWWKCRIQWEKWCRASSTTNASSAEVSNARSVSCSGYRKRLLDVVTTECLAAVLETAEVRRQNCGLKTVGKGPTVADRAEKEENTLLLEREQSASAIQFVEENAEKYTLLSNIEMAEEEYHVNTCDTHRADKKKKRKKHRVKPIRAL